MAMVLIPGILRAYTEDMAELEIPGDSLEEILDHLSARYPDFGSRLRSREGSVRGFLNIYVNGQDIRRLQGMGTPVSERDRVQLIPAIAGGAD